MKPCPSSWVQRSRPAALAKSTTCAPHYESGMGELCQGMKNSLLLSLTVLSSTWFIVFIVLIDSAVAAPNQILFVDIADFFLVNRRIMGASQSKRNILQH